MENVKFEIAKKLEEVLKDLEVSEVSITISHPVDSSKGDYSTNIAMVLAKKLGKNPLDLANELKEKLGKIEGIEKIDAAAPGFLNFWISKDNLFKNLSEVLETGEKYGKSEKNKGKKVLVEFSSPNIAKPFTVGHLRSTIIGSAISNLLRATGWEVSTDNHLGDWGTQFGKQIYAIKTWGNEEKIDKAENPVKELVALYVKFHEEAEKNLALEDEARAWFKKLEDGDTEAKRLWQKCIEWSMKEFEKLYEVLGVSFDTQYGESFFEDKMEEVISELREKKILRKENGAELVFFEKDKFPPLMVMKSDGATLYATRDLATDKFRLKTYGDDVVIVNEVGSEQSLYFKQLFETEKMLGWIKDGQRIHVAHGLYRFKDQKMSTRKGNTIWLEDVLEEAEKRAKGLAKEESSDVNFKTVSIGAIKWNDLKRDHAQDIVFDWDDVLNMQGNSGPYIQYTFARTQSVLSKAGSHQSEVENLELEKEEAELVRELHRFSEVIEEAGNNFMPNILCQYLFELCQKYNLFYQKHKIIGGEKEEFRLSLTKAVGQVIKNGLFLLGIESPVKM